MIKDQIEITSAFDLFLPKLRKQIKKLFKIPTQIQQKAINEILKGNNVLLIAPTGTGKTEAGIFPIFNQFLKSNELKGQGKGISILYITPLRALNRDIFRRIVTLGKTLDISVEIRHGDTKPSVRRKQALRPPDMLISTPETLQAILPGKRIREHLRAVQWVIVDEIHELVDSKRGIQLTLGLERLRELTEHDFQRIGLSATIGTPKIIAKFLQGSSSPVKIIRTSFEKELEIAVESPIPQSDPKTLMKKLMTTPDSIARIQRIVELVKAHQSVLIFVNTRATAELLASRMKLFQPPFTLAVHHGSLSKEVRIESEQKFKEDLKCIICTSSLELGIDIGTIDYIIQYGSPRQVTRLTQRVGRSGHQIGKVSRGTIICLNEIDDICESMVIAKNTILGNLEQIKLHKNALDALAHQIIGILLDKGASSIEEIYTIVTRAYPYHNLKKALFIETLEQLSRQELIYLERNGNIHKRRGNWLNYYSFLTMIPDIQKYKIIDVARNRPIGTLDEDFVSEHCKINSIFIIKGTPWKILAIDEQKIEAVEIQDPKSGVPSWVGEIIPVPYAIAQEVGRIRAEMEAALTKNQIQPPILDEYNLTEDAKKIIIDTIQAHLQKHIPISNHKTILIEELEKHIVIHACFGTLVNETLSRIIASLLSSRVGASIGVRVDPYRIILSLPRIISPLEILELFFKIDQDHIVTILDVTLKRSSMFRYRFFHIAKYFGIIKKDARYKDINISRFIRIFKYTPVYKETMRTVLNEKLDVQKSLDILKQIKNKEIEVQLLQKKDLKPSPLAIPAMQWVAPRDLIIPERSRYQIQRVVRDRLLNRQIKLVCMYCRKYSSYKTVKLLPEKPECPKCQSRFLAVLPVEGINIRRILNLKDKGKKLSKEDEQIFERAQKSANLVLSYGKKVIIALAGYGIGPATATRLLSVPYKNEYEFIQAIIDAEKQFIKTRPFWKDEKT
ncbi:MAG: DEAD/DEAH box helicase [Candidatus Helarchaeota archaeon]|nr:DEAD/DEAH box helicase [Candidatus Helarchaeota archaeon]